MNQSIMTILTVGIIDAFVSSLVNIVVVVDFEEFFWSIGKNGVHLEKIFTKNDVLMYWIFYVA